MPAQTTDWVRRSTWVAITLFTMVWVFCAVIGALDLLQHAGVIPSANRL